MLNNLDKKVQARILNALRLIWFQTFRAKALSTRALKTPLIKKDGTPSKLSRIDGFKCDDCKYVYPKYCLQVDHIIPVKSGKTFVERLDILFCDITNLQVLCKECHRLKTNRERKL